MDQKKLTVGDSNKTVMQEKKYTPITDDGAPFLCNVCGQRDRQPFVKDPDKFGVLHAACITTQKES
jgi:hypothetical protein